MNGCNQFSKEVDEFEKDSKWFFENINSLRRQNFEGKFVAIKNKEVVASGIDFNIVVKMVEETKINPAYVVIEYVYPEKTIVLL